MRKAPINLSSPCSACGRSVGGGLHYCPGCKIALCMLCALELMWIQRNGVARARCPMCGEYFPQ